MIKKTNKKWPLASDFVSALQNPKSAFRDEDLKKATIKKSGMGLPEATSGSFAVVFQANIPGSGKLAIRCFTKYGSERTERYQHMSLHLQQAQGPSPLVGFEYREKDDGIRVLGAKYPFITMEWVEGETFEKWLGNKCEQGDGRAILSMSDRWQELVSQLHSLEISHGDLQHGNVMVTPNEQLKLVDYDCMCVPKLVGRKNMEIGVVPYQHPERNGETRLSLDLDNFSSNFIFTALRALAAEPGLWGKHVVQRNYDKILFHREDFDAPGQSGLFRDLKHSPDSEVQRFANDLSDHWNGSFQDVPPLNLFVWSWDPVTEAIDAGAWRKVVELADRQTGQDVPVDLVPKIQKARDLVAALDNLIKAVNAGDEQSMARHYKPDLLKGWPEASKYLVIAEKASDVIQLNGQLDSLLANKQGRELVDLWKENADLLDNRKSMEANKTAVSKWSKRNGLCDVLLRLKDQLPPPIDKLEENWQKLDDLGGHPEIEPHKEKIRFLISQQRSYEKWASIPATLSESNDLKRVSLWKEDLFKNWPTAEAQRQHLNDSRQRLVIIAQLKQLCQVHDVTVTREGERQIETTAGQLTDSYQHSLDDRVKLAVGRLQAFKQLVLELRKKPIIDSKLASCYENLKKLGGQALLPGDFHPLCKLAVERKPIIVALEQLPEDLAADTLDEKLLDLWNVKLLSSCVEAQKWIPRYTLAVKRKEKLENLGMAIESGDEFRIVEAADETCLKDYPLPIEWQRAIEKARDVVGTVQQLCEAITNDDPDAFREHFDGAILKKHGDRFKDIQDDLEKMIRSAIMPANHLGLKISNFGQSLHTLPKSKNLKVTARWDWPSGKFTSQCLLGITEFISEARLSPEDSSVIYLDPISLDRYEAAGGKFQIHVESSWLGYHVLVWAEVDAGIGMYKSSPIVLGQILP